MKYMSLDQRGKVMAEYVWIDSVGGVRSKTKVCTLLDSDVLACVRRRGLQIRAGRLALRLALVRLPEQGRPLQPRPRQPLSLSSLALSPPLDKPREGAMLPALSQLSSCVTVTMASVGGRGYGLCVFCM